MGNCLPTQKKKKLRKSVKLKRTPREEKQRIDEILSKSSNCQNQNQNEPTDMAKALQVEDTDDTSATLESPPTTKKAIVFTVELEDAPEPHKPVSTDGPVADKTATVSTVELDDTPPKTVSPDGPAPTKKAVTFTVEIGEEKAETNTPKQLADRAEKKEEPKSEIVYTNDEESLMDAILAEMGDVKSEDTKAVNTKKTYTLDERSLMADIMREDRLKEIKEKARQEEVKRYDAKMKRLAMERSKEARAESKTAGSAPGVDVKRKKVRDLAAQDRRMAAERRGREELE